MSNENLKIRTKRFALEVIKFVETLPRDRTCDVLGRQLLRSGTSVGANYRAACRAKSSADFISKLGNVEEESDESEFWMGLLLDADKTPATHVRPLMREAGELTAINTTKRSSGRSAASRSPIPHSALRTPN